MFKGDPLQQTSRCSRASTNDKRQYVSSSSLAPMGDSLSPIHQRVPCTIVILKDQSDENSLKLVRGHRSPSDVLRVSSNPGNASCSLYTSPRLSFELPTPAENPRGRPRLAALVLGCGLRSGTVCSPEAGMGQIGVVAMDVLGLRVDFLAVAALHMESCLSLAQMGGARAFLHRWLWSVGVAADLWAKRGPLWETL